MPNEKLLTPRQVAAWLGCRPETCRRLLAEGKLPGAMIGGRWRIPERALLDRINGNTLPHTAALRGA